MDRIFVCGEHNRESIIIELVKLLHEKDCSITDLQVIKVEEGNELDFNMETFTDVEQLADIILTRLEDFKSACVMMGKEVNDKDFSVVMYLIFVKTNDPDLFTALSMI